tara:strand:- start:1998 stop:2285 length:288 start_codon:yes stop_codon:yes gene_type:complete
MNHKETISNLINLRDVLKEIMGKDDGVKPYLSSISEAVHLMASETVSFDTKYYKVELVEHNKGILINIYHKIEDNFEQIDLDIDRIFSDDISGEA